MTDLTDAQRVTRAHNAKRALEEFLDPAFVIVHDEYSARLKEICAKRPWATNEIAALANASRIVEEVRGQIAGLVYDGEVARKGMIHAQEIEKLSPSRKRLLNIASW